VTASSHNTRVAYTAAS